MADATGKPTESFEQEYAREVTELSYQELRELALQAKAHGPEFYVIGGWAAWRHHQTLGSRDIDVIFADTGIMDAFLRRYYDMRGFVNTGGFLAKRMRKRVMVDARSDPVEIEIDAAGITQGPPLKEDKTRNLPFTLLDHHHETWDLDGPSTKIPTRELLILQKVKAHRDRSFDLERETSPIQTAWLRSKIWKDAHDIRGIAASGPLDWGTARRIASEHAVEELVHDTLGQLKVAHW